MLVIFVSFYLEIQKNTQLNLLEAMNQLLGAIKYSRFQSSPAINGIIKLVLCTEQNLANLEEQNYLIRIYSQ